MDQILEREEVVKKYLLGELGETEQEEVELRLLTGRKYLDELLLVEEELTDDFVFGVLPQHERQKVIDHFLVAPERRQKLLDTLSLKRYVERVGGTRSAYPAWEFNVWGWGRPLSALRGVLSRRGRSLGAALKRQLSGLLGGRPTTP
ncbi:MAG: hypothetical protein M3416_18700, partial [Acidobacteriota bacterium]|nr:hypothetical protein [Acidobacteriota bacterium]